MAEIIDLDELLGADKKVRLHGKVYVLPPDLPAELYLSIMRLAREDASEAEMIEALYDQLLQLFRYKQPDLQSVPGVTVSQLVFAVAKIYGDGGGEAQPRPPRATRGGTTSKRPRTS